LDQVEYVKCSTSLPVLQEFFIDSAFQCSQTEQRSWVRGPPARILQYTAQFQEVAHDREWAQLFLPPARILQYTAQFRHLLNQQTIKGGFRTRSYRCGHMQQTGWESRHSSHLPDRGRRWKALSESTE
jgi:hypothetical protein